MAFEPFSQMLRILQGKRTNGSISDVQNSQQMAFLRRLQKEVQQEDVLYIPLQDLPVVVFDIETTGFKPEKGDSILSIGGVKMRGPVLLEEEFYSLVHFDKAIPPEIVELTRLTNEQVMEADPLVDVLIKFYQFKQDCTFVAHHANHERNFLQYASTKLFHTPFKHRIVDTAFLFKVVERNKQPFSLEDLCTHNGIPVTNRHHALSDAKMTAKLWGIYLEKAMELGCENLSDVYSRYASI